VNKKAWCARSWRKPNAPPVSTVSLAAVHREWDATGESGLVFIMEITQLDAKTTRRIVKLIQDSL
jgi:hypothetical protein